jgi:uncharacterized membrane protein YkvA (DUF1232 family)
MFKKLRYTYKLYTVLKQQNKIPVKANVVLIAMAIYILMPLDVLPDPIAIIGWLDDIFILGTALRYINKALNTTANPADKARANAIDV